MKPPLRLLRVACLLLAAPTLAPGADGKSGNPVFPGHYADPEGTIFGDRYWIYPTYSAPYDEQVFLDAFSSPDLVTWTKHPRILDNKAISWAKRAIWAPSVVEKGGKYYLFFGANDIQNDREPGGIGVAVADKPDGPFRDHLGEPLIDKFHNGAQPIDQFAFRDTDGSYYLIYGGWRHCNIVRLNDTFTALVPFADGTTYKEITPEGYVEGPFMFVRGGKYYFMWSEGGWTGPNYSVAYAIADSPFGPFKRLDRVLRQDRDIATGAGHHSVIQVPGTDEYYAVYHRRPIGQTDANARVTCIDRMEFAPDGTIKPIRITRDGVAARPLVGRLVDPKESAMTRPLAAALSLLVACTPAENDGPRSFPGRASRWEGFARRDFRVDGADAIVVEPESPLPGRPWVWRGEFFGAFPAADVALLGQGWHVAYLGVPDLFGSPRAVARWEKLYDVLTKQHNLDPRPALLGMSRGALYCLGWAAAHPDRTLLVYLDNGVCDFRSWPGGRPKGLGRGAGSPGEWAKLLRAYDFRDDADAIASPLNPINNLAPIARARIPILLVYGDADRVVPPDENSAVVFDRYRALGGPIERIVKPGGEHHPHGLPDLAPIVAFFEHARRPVGDPRAADGAGRDRRGPASPDQ